MNVILYIAIIIIAGVYVVNRMLYHMHMFQLNSYRIERYFRFLKTKRQNLLNIGFVMFCIIIFSTSLLYTFIIEFQEIYILLIWFAVVLIRTIPLYMKKEKTKKPLVYTMRVNRMFFVIALVYLIGILLLIKSPICVFAVTMGMLLVPFILLLGNLILKPVELYLKRYYYKDAKKILTEHKDLIKIGITGSYGKTSTKFILETILSQQFITLVTPHSYNTTLGVIITVRKKLNCSTEIFIAEMGAKQTNDIKEICDLVIPDYGMITAVGPQHLETFGSLSNVINTKFEMMEAIKDKGKGFVNGDSVNIQEGMKRFNQVDYVSYGSNEYNNVRVENVSSTIHGSTFTVISNKGKQEFRTKLLGMHNILNITGAISVAQELGMSYEKIAIGVKEIKPITHRLELKRQGNYFILDDAFNANPTGAKCALEVLSQFESGKKIIMTPGMIELGNMDKEVHYEFGKQIAATCDYIILIGEKKTIDIYRGLQDTNYNMSNVEVLKSVYEGFASINKIIQKGDVVLIENDLPDNFNE